MPQQIITSMSQKLQGALEHLKDEFSKLQTGRASAGMVDGLMVDSYGTKMQLKAVASITIPEAKQIAIQPWDRGQITAIEKAIRESNLGLNPQNDGVVIRLMLPPLTEERRKDLVKVMHRLAEEAKISARNARHESLNELKAKEKNKEIGEDVLKINEKEVQAKIDDFNKKVDEAAKAKEADIMTV